MRLYRFIRDLHLYLGLACAPFVLAFSISVFFLVHAWIPGSGGAPGPPQVVRAISLPSNLEDLAGRARVEALHSVLAGIGVNGEIGFVRHDPKARRLLMPVMVPGREITVEIALDSGTATVTQRETGVWDALVTLHKAPGPHLADIRMNWWPMRVWQWLVDGTVYLLLFSAASGVYLWLFLRSERRIGFALLAAGLVTFTGMVYALAY